MTFFFFALGFMSGGRKLGWALSRAMLYNAPVADAVTLSLAWGIVVAGAMRAVLNWQEPGAVLRWIMGYAWLRMWRYRISAFCGVFHPRRRNATSCSRVESPAYHLHHGGGSVCVCHSRLMMT